MPAPNPGFGRNKSQRSLVPTPRKGPFRKIGAIGLLNNLYFPILIKKWRALCHSSEAPLAAVRFREKETDRDRHREREREREIILALLHEADRG